MRTNLPVIKTQPNKTWNPWNPVAKKKILPYPLLIKVYVASIYSWNWINKKYTPNTKVNNKVTTLINQLLLKIEKWDQVINTPEDNKIIVFNKGILKGLILWIPLGGQTPPNSKSTTNTKSK